MTDSPTQLALREWRREMTNPVTLVVLAGVSGVLTLIGPFSTETTLSLMERAVYWVAVVFLCYGAGSLAHSMVSWRFSSASQATKFLLSALATGVAVSLIVVVVNRLSLGFLPEGSEWVSLLGTIFAICFIVSGVLTFAFAQTRKQTEPLTDAAPSILDRLPLDKRGPLIALSVEDHYVRIITTKGEDMVLMRLSDAIRETGNTKGAQVHRSHWVAFDQVKAARKEGDRAILTLSNGAELPVSRANVPVIKEARLLPR